DVSAPHWGLYVFIAVLAAAGLFAWWQLGSNGLSGNRLAALVQEARGKLSQQKQEAAAVAPNANPAAAENAAAPSASTPASNAPGNASPAGPSGTANAATPPPSAAEIQNAAQKQNVPAPPAALSQTAAVAAPPSPAPRKAVRQPRATDAVDNTRSADAESAALLSNAQKYLYGDGVPQSCDRALGYLRQAVDNDSAKAKSTLGGLYATGHCAPLDRATAYRWFALALRQEPNNSYLSHDLEMLWNQMTPAEKQRAIHMTQ
ncbi:MAG TPA: hypothetical protein VKT29_08105, partial [Terriglobales bacterium]|nr:hypothetical protein [Terriglobales bacterium]